MSTEGKKSSVEEVSKEDDMHKKLAEQDRQARADEMKSISRGASSTRAATAKALHAKLEKRPEREAFADKFMRNEEKSDSMFNRSVKLDTLLSKRTDKSKLAERNIINEGNFGTMDNRSAKLDSLLSKRLEKSKLTEMNIISEGGVSIGNRGAKLGSLLAKRTEKSKLTEMNIIEEEHVVEEKKTQKTNRSAQLDSLLLKRADRSRLTELNIIKEENRSTSSISRMQQALKRAQMKDKLSSFLTSRTDKESLLNSRILKSVDEVEEEQKGTEDAKNVLSSFLQNRPSPSELVEKKVVEDVAIIHHSLAQKCNVGNGNQLTPARVLALKGINIVQASAGFSHNVVLSDKGDVYVFGHGSNGKLGRGADEKDVATPTLCQSLKDKGAATAVYCGDNHSAAIVNGDVYTWGTGSWGRLGLDSQADVGVPTKVEVNEEKGGESLKIKGVSCGAYHTLFLTECGRVFACGWNNKGRVGIVQDSSSLSVLKPVEVKFNGVEKMVAVRAGEHCSFAWDDKGSLFSWGGGNKGILASGDEEDRNEPVLVKGLLVRDVAVGSVHVLAVSRDGHLFSWGSNKDAQLGSEVLDGDVDNGMTVFKPRAVGLKGAVSCISAGKVHSAAVKDGVLYTWGKGGKGVLGLNSELNVAVPEAIPNGFESKKISSVSTGWTHTIAVTADGGLYSFGSSSLCKLGL